MVRDDRKLVVIQGAATKPVVRVFTAAGQALAAFMWDRGRVVGMGWSSQEDLLIVEDTGQVCCTMLESLTSMRAAYMLSPCCHVLTQILLACRNCSKLPLWNTIMR